MDDEMLWPAAILLLVEQGIVCIAVFPHRHTQIVTELRHQRAYCRVGVQTPALVAAELLECGLCLRRRRAHLTKPRPKEFGKRRLDAAGHGGERKETRADAEARKVPAVNNIAQTIRIAGWPRAVGRWRKWRLHRLDRLGHIALRAFAVDGQAIAIAIEGGVRTEQLALPTARANAAAAGSALRKS